MKEEKYLFPSEEWIAKFMELLNANEAYRDSAKKWEGDFVFEVIPDGELVKESIRFYIDLWHGDCRDARMAKPDDTAEFIYAGPYKNWLLLFEGKIDPIKGIMSRKFKLTGDMGKIMRYTKAAAELVATANQVPTIYLGEEE
ncbi:MAG: SCP2 sterol-binding domain-containing protein [Candidatus Thorarchaeota archaeon]